MRISLECGRIPPIFSPASELKAGNPEFNLQQEISGDMRVVARRRGFVAGFSETRRKIPAPSCEKLTLPTPSERLLLKAHTLPFLFTLFSNLSFAEEAKLN